MAEPNITAAWNLITQGHIVQAVIGIFTNILGAWFWVLIFALGISMTYLRSKNFGSTLVVGYLLSPLLIPLFEAGFGQGVGVIMYPIFLFIALGLTTLFYKVFKGTPYG